MHSARFTRSCRLEPAGVAMTPNEIRDFLLVGFLGRLRGRNALWPIALVYLVLPAILLGAFGGYGIPFLFSNAAVAVPGVVLSYVALIVCAFLLDADHPGQPGCRALGIELPPFDLSRYWLKHAGVALWHYGGPFTLCCMVLAFIAASGAWIVQQFLRGGATLKWCLGIVLVLCALVVLIKRSGILTALRTIQAKTVLSSASTSPLVPVGAESPSPLAGWFARLPEWSRECILPAIFVVFLQAPNALLYWASVLAPETRVLLAWTIATAAVTLASVVSMPPLDQRAVRGYRALGLLAFGLFVLVVWIAAFTIGPLYTAVSVLILVTSCIIVYTLLCVYGRMSLPAIVILFAAMFGVAELASESGSPTRVLSLRDFYSVENRRSISDDGFLRPGAPPSAHELLRHTLGTSPVRRPIVVLAVSGGGISAAVWTMSVLTEIERRCPQFPNHVEVITGASGGMLGATFYTATLEPKPKDASFVTSDAIPLDTATLSSAGWDWPLHHVDPVSRKVLDGEALRRRIGGDSLSGVARMLAVHDIPDALLFTPSEASRGQALNASFSRITNGALDLTFDNVRGGEEQGWRPSLIFSPTMVEDGRRLLISNLDLETLSRTKHDSPASSGREVSRDAIELFRVIPEARQMMTLAEAARLAAGFPYVSPAAELPFKERRRAVDAGYYDNHGVDIACRWINENREWLDKNAQSVLILQIRTFGPSEPGEGEAASPGVGEEALAPVVGLLSSREAAMSHRNNQQVSMLTDHFADGKFPPIKTMLLSCPVEDIPLTWALPESMLLKLQNGVHDPSIARELDTLVSWLRGGGDQAWKEDVIVERLRAEDAKMSAAVEASGTGADPRSYVHLAPRIIYAIAEDEVSSWMLFRDGSEWEGFDLRFVEELGRRLTRKLGLKNDIVMVRAPDHSWRHLLDLPRRGKADMVLSSISFRPEREHWHEIEFSVPYYKTGQAVVYLAPREASSGARGEIMLKGVIGVQEGTTSDLLLQSLPGRDAFNRKTYKTLRDAIALLRPIDAGSPDAPTLIVTDEPLVTLMQLYVDPNLSDTHEIRIARDLSDGLNDQIRGEIFERDEYYSIGVARDRPQFLWLLNSIIGEMHKDGAIARLEAAAQDRASAAAGRSPAPMAPAARPSTSADGPLE